MQTMLNVVLYEEDFLMRDLLQEWLTEAGYDVRAAAARDLQSGGQADLVIASVYMPKAAGRGIHTKHTRRTSRDAHIAISGQFRAGLCQAGATAQALGVQQVIAKPLIRSDLVGSVRAMIGASD